MEKLWFLAICGIIGVVVTIPWDEKTALDEYVHSDDDYYSWEVVREYRYNICTLFIVNMTSQMYQNESFVSGPLWWHFMGVAIPDADNLTHPDSGFLFINGGSTDYNRDPPDETEPDGILLCDAAVEMGIIGGYIRAVPNQPLVFTNDPTQRSRSEDSIIAWTWRTFLDNLDADPSIILRMPMTKAAKRGLDTINEVAVARGNNPAITNVTKFGVSGASKRGWTTWSLAATDQRVVAIAPLVFSLLNFNETLMAHYQAMGGAWSFAFESYYRENLTQELLTERAHEAFQYEDMYVYRERLTLPILQVVATGDEFFLCQDSRHWWDGIPDPKWTYMMENAEHTMYPHYLKIYNTVVAMFGHILEGIPLPQMSWSFGEDPDGRGFVEVRTDRVPETAEALIAVTLGNDTRRDFRLAEGSSQNDIYFHPVMWRNHDNLTIDEENMIYRTSAQPTENEWSALVIKLMFRGPGGQRMFMTSETNIFPDTQPVERCTDGESCYGTMV